jgi:hypothetical protein
MRRRRRDFEAVAYALVIPAAWGLFALIVWWARGQG